jgi:class 3 adenylate cyclase
MEPRIQYVKTEDGVSIGFYTLGAGTPLVYMPPPWTFIETGWQIPGARHWEERLAEKRMLVRYDNREVVPSAGEAAQSRLDAELLDLGAVVDSLAVDKVVLYATLMSGPAAIAYAAHNSERVSSLILAHCVARGSDLLNLPQVEGLVALLDKDWEMFTETFTRVGLGWSAGELASQGAALYRELLTPERVRADLEAVSLVDVTDLLPGVRSPTLVLHRRQVTVPPVAAARGLASGIPSARLLLLEGTSLAPYVGDTGAMYAAMDEFLSGAGEASATNDAPEASAFRTVLFTDVEGSTALTDRLGDAKARELLREHERITRDALVAHGGSEVKTMGDGFMASFGSVTKAVECAIAMQRAFAERNESAEEPVKVRIGLNAGEPIEEEGDLFGTTVIVASRIAAKADGGETLVSDNVRSLSAGKGFLFSDRGEFVAKGYRRAGAGVRGGLATGRMSTVAESERTCQFLRRITVG